MAAGVLSTTDRDLEFPVCPLCRGFDFDVVIERARDRVSRKDGDFQVHRCEGCGLVMTRPRPKAAALALFYEGTYSGPGAGRARTVQAGIVGDWVARYRLRAVRNLQPLDQGQRLLDVGCGYGAFAARARRATGCEVVAVDIDAGCIADALDAQYVRYVCGTLADLRLEPAQFDVITFFESLEHHAEPMQALRTAWDLLKPGGICVVEVPNFSGFWRPVFGTWWLPLLVPQHLVHFTPATLRRSFDAAGFEPLSSHAAMFYPVESTASLGLWLNERLGRPIRSYRLRWRRPDGVLLLALLAVWWALVEVPSQALLAMAGRTGHQLMGARKSPARK